MWRVLVVAIVMLAGCEEERPTEAQSTMPAGEVVEVTGIVWVKQAGTKVAGGRILKRGDVVLADEVIETEPDASIAIELRHNKVRWSLGGGQRARVDESLAWKLERQEADDTPVDHATSAAGRHAERTAADTKETVTNGPGPTGGEHTTAEQPQTTQPPKPVMEPRPEQPQTKQPPKPAMEPKDRDTKAGGGGCDEVSCALQPDQACCKKAQKRKGPADMEDVTAERRFPETLTKEHIQRAVKALTLKIRACGETTSAKGMVRLTVEVKPDGSVASVTVKETPEPALGACVAAAMRRARFESTQRGGAFNYPFVF
jgi:TonB family protein